eukprot:TRINITY_DN74310_c0_g1_i1.p1 TRINITY_DN74310_c0_g1~~TRINITY_DN74310_c0_g1_i1.p1  ORF type:complete len:374 (+),score=31.28 TRINITY_DN74310_c0_g1_i1:86-1207(+)
MPPDGSLAVDRDTEPPSHAENHRFGLRAVFYLLRNGWKAVAGLVLDFLRCGLACYNWRASWLAFTDMTGPVPSSFAGWLILPYTMTLLAPCIRLKLLLPILRSFLAQETPVLQALAIASQPASLMAYEAAQRTEAVYSRTQPRPHLTASMLRVLMVFYKAKLGTAEELSLLGQTDFDDAFRHVDMGCRCRRSKYSRERYRKKAAKMVPEIEEFVNGHPDSRVAFSGLVCCRTVAGALQLDGLDWVEVVAPSRVLLLTKLKLLTAGFDIAFYIVNLRHGTFVWNDLQSAWTWHVKLCLAFVSLSSLRRIWWMSEHWDWTRLGVLSDAPWPLEATWSHWVSTSKRSFSWQGSSNMWDALPVRGQSSSRAPLARSS